MDFLKENKTNVILGVLALLFVIFIIIGSRSENFQDTFYLDDMAMKHPDPIFFHYTGRDKDVLGQSGRDYYLENKLLSQSGAIEQKLTEDAFKNQMHYRNMPKEYRPEDPLWASENYKK